MGAYTGADRNVNRGKNEQQILLVLLRDIRQGEIEPSFKVPKVTIGNQCYNLVGYRSPQLYGIYSVFILANDVETGRTAFVLRTNWFDSDENIRRTLFHFFEVKSPHVVNTAFDHLRKDGHYLMEPVKELLAQKLKLPFTVKEANKKMFHMVFNFADEAAKLDMAA